MRTLAAALPLALACTACGTDRPEPDDLGAIVERALGDIGHVSPDSEELEHQIYQLGDTELVGEVTAESCDAVDTSLAGVCDELVQGGETAYCGYNTAFFYAHQVPRCAVRFELYPAYETGVMHPTYVIDFAGTPLTGPEPTCGNGVLDEGEDCDDGNHELWDGCDSNCENEPFQGCETVIEDIYRQAGIAEVAASEWSGPRSHLMVNRNGHAMQAVDASTCNAAIATGTDVCNQLVAQMPFVSWCQPGGELYQDDAGSACSVRLQVWFSQLDSDFGVFTTSLPGLLAFTIR